jgi:hypothetical protein
MIEGDGQTVAYAEEIFGGELKITLTPSTTLAAVCELATVSLEETPSGLTEAEVTRRLGAPFELVQDESGDRWARWRRPGGLLEVGNPAIGSSSEPEIHRWVTRFNPSTHDLGSVLSPPVMRYIRAPIRFGELAIVSPSEHRRLWITLGWGRIRYIYMLPIPNEVGEPAR